ncbi:hypothetical protein [Microtetraspora fusca]|uniref:DUF1795 domain-containing protein n=1 Tax=Microtetraspora fusca TaxID=1997 RepID=A0ABW6V6C1_MICFU|nr:hypothetical protein [Microtetraspora fusca]
MDEDWTRRVWPPSDQDDTVRAEPLRGGAVPPGAAPDAAGGGVAGRAGQGAAVGRHAVPGGFLDDDPDETLPPSASRYGTPTPPPRRMPRWMVRLVVGTLASAAAGLVIGVLVVTVMGGTGGAPAGTVHDPLARVAYDLPPGWREGVVAPVTGFTSVAVHEQATVMARHGERADPADPRPAVVSLTDMYGRLLLRGDKIDVVDDRAVTTGSRRGYTRALRAEYRDAVNQPAFLRVTLLVDAEGTTTVLLGLAHPDEPVARAEIDAVMGAVR